MSRGFRRSFRCWWPRLPAWVAMLMIILPAPGLFAQTCGAAGGDNRPSSAASCESEVPEPASHPGLGPATATTNSIDLVTGNKYLRAIDVAWPGGLVLARHYNSRNAQSHGLGTAWTHSFDTRLAKVRTKEPARADAQGAGKASARAPRARWEVQVMQADGRRIVFTQRSPAGKKKSGSRVKHWEPIEIGYGQIREDSRADAQQRFVWSWQDGRELHFDEQGRLTRVELPEGERLSLQWSDDPSLLRAVVGRTGQRLSFEYSGPPPTGDVGRQARATAGAMPRLSAVVHPDGLRTRYSHDPHGQLVAVAHGDEAALAYRYEDDTSFHRLTEVVDARGLVLARFAYDAGGRAVRSSLVAGRQAIQVDYRVAGEGEQGVGNAGAGEHIRDGKSPATGAAQSMRGESIVTDDAGRVTRYHWEYDRHLHRARLVSSRGPGCVVCPDANVDRVHDARGRLVQEIDHDADRRSHWHYDTTGRLQRVTYVQGSVHNRSGRHTREQFVAFRYRDDSPDAPLVALVRSSVAPGRLAERHWVRDSHGRVVGQTETGWRPRPGSADSSLLARDWSPIVRTLAARASPIATHRLAMSALQAQAVLAWPRASGTQAAWLLDDFGLQIAELDRDRGVTVHRYDDSGRRIASLDDRGRHHVATHDALGRITSRGLRGDPSAVQVRHEGERLVTISDPLHTRALLRDAGGRVIAEANLLGERRQGPEAARLFVTTHRFDAAGHLAGQTLPNGHALGYSHTPQGRLQAIAWRSPAGNTRMIVQHSGWHPDAMDSRGLASLEFGNGTRMHLDFDVLGRVVRIRHRSARATPATLRQLHLFRGADDRIHRIDHDGRPTAYVHDARGRLIGAADADGAEGFAYSPDGERTAHHRSGSEKPAEAGPGAVQPPVLDFSDEGLLRSVRRADGTQFRYWYDARGWRIAKSRESSLPARTFYLYRDDRLVGEADASGVLTVWYVRIGERPIAMLRFDRDPQGEVFWLHGDHLGTPIAATDAAGTLRWSARYGPFGERRQDHHRPAVTRSHSVPLEVPLRMPGQYHDEESGLYYNLHRYYDPRLGAYLTPDPLGVIAGPARFAYAGGDPLGAIDPTGLYQNDVHFFMTYFLARTAGLGGNTSLTIASAAQYIDDNPFTRPLPIGAARNGPVVLGGVGDQIRRLAAYHFTQDTFDPAINVGEDPQDHALRRVVSPRNPQLAALLGYANGNLRTASNPTGLSACARAQFFGEFLHAYQDTFSHRGNLNVPIGLNGGFGHLAYGTAPDVTFNTIGPGGLRYDLNEYRTFVMEQEVFTLFQQNFGAMAMGPELTPITFTQIEPVLHAFNATQEAGCLGEDCWPIKLAMLDDALDRFNLGDLPVYDARDAQARRVANLRGLAAADYPRAILDTPQR